MQLPSFRKLPSSVATVAMDGGGIGVFGNLEQRRQRYGMTVAGILIYTKSKT